MKNKSFSVGDLPKTLWVEAKEKSTSVCDIVIDMEYKDKDIKDTVKATAYWVDVTHMAFNHDRTKSGNDGANIRSSYTAKTEHHAPEYVSPTGGRGLMDISAVGKYNQKTVLYAQDMNVKAKVRFTITPSAPNAASAVKLTATAIDASSTTRESVGIAGLKATVINFEKGVSKGSKVANKDGFVELSCASKTEKRIQKEVANFEYELSTITIGKVTLTTNTRLGIVTGIKIYTTLAIPNGGASAPWDDKDTNGDDKMQPWVSALEFAVVTSGVNSMATQVACGSSTDPNEDPIARITKFLYDTYGYPADTAARFVTGPFPPNNQNVNLDFNYTDYMAGAYGNTANCDDSALGLTCTGNILGLTMQPVEHRPFPGYDYHCYVLFGGLIYDCTRGTHLYSKGKTFDQYQASTRCGPVTQRKFIIIRTLK